MLGGGLVLALSACATSPADPVAASPAPATDSAQPVPAESEPAEAVAALPPEPEIDDDPAQLLGLQTASLEDLLGTPELVRRESPAQVWQYRTSHCVLDVVLYDEAGDSQVTYVEARDRKGGRLEEARPCLNELLRARQAAPAS